MTALILDTETTGFSPHQDRVIELAIVRFDNGETVFHSYINPERPIPPEITEITKITDDHMVGAPTFAQVAPVVAGLISAAEAIIGHNIYFDRGMISGEFARIPGLECRWPQVVCTKRVWDVYEPKEKRSLTNAFKRFVDPAGFEGAHGALADTVAARSVILKQIETFNLHGKSWKEFDPEQSTWVGSTGHIIVTDGVLIVNFGKHKGTPCHMVDKGFWRWILNQDFPEHVNTIAGYIHDGRDRLPTADELYNFVYGRFLK